MFQFGVIQLHFNKSSDLYHFCVSFHNFDIQVGLASFCKTCDFGIILKHFYKSSILFHFCVIFQNVDFQCWLYRYCKMCEVGIVLQLFPKFLILWHCLLFSRILTSGVVQQFFVKRGNLASFCTIFINFRFFTIFVYFCKTLIFGIFKWGFEKE